MSLPAWKAKTSTQAAPARSAFPGPPTCPSMRKRRRSMLPSISRRSFSGNLLALLALLAPVVARADNCMPLSLPVYLDNEPLGDIPLTACGDDLKLATPDALAFLKTVVNPRDYSALHKKARQG